MALQVWLPLDGDLKNRGLADVTVTNNMATIDDNGKIGKCYKTSESVRQYIDTGVKCSDILEEGGSFTLALWINFQSFPANTSSSGGFYGSGIICSNQYMDGGFGINIVTWDGDTWQISYDSSATDGNVTQFISGIYGLTNSDLNKWMHICWTFDSKTCKNCWYKNGELVNSGFGTNGVKWEYNDTTFLIGANTQGGWGNPYSSMLNDVRIYDNCLSAAEVKEISRGLVLHYPLNDAYIEPTINVDPARNSAPDFHDGGTVEKVHFKGRDCWHCRCSLSGSEWHGYRRGFSPTQNGFSIGDIVTASCKLYVPSGQNTTNWMGNFPLSYWEGGLEKISDIKYDWANGTYDIWKDCYATFRITDNNADILYYWLAGEGDCSIEFYITDMQIEKKDHATPYTPSSRNENTVYDCAGYGHNGTVEGSLSVSADSPRYSVATLINQQTTITHPRCLSDEDQEWTCCAWIKMSSVVNYAKSFNNFNMGNSLVFGTEPLLYLNYGADDYYVYGNQGLPLNEWIHIAFVFRNNDGYKKIYLNGNDITGDGPTSYVITGIPYVVTLFEGYEGLVSDYREYSTALSETDIQELYNTGAKIAKNGTLMCYELKED